MTDEIKLGEELDRFKECVVVHDLPDSFHYITNQYLIHLTNSECGVSSFEALFARYIAELKQTIPEENIRVLSIGSGNCDREINMVKSLGLKCRIVCCDVNAVMISRGKAMAAENGLSGQFDFFVDDINTMRIKEPFDIFIASHSLHHLVELEHVFEEISNSMKPHSVFIVDDVIGRNGHMYWDSTLKIANKLWNVLPGDVKYNHQLKMWCPTLEQWDCSTEGFEGIRAQDILPLMDRLFTFERFIPFFCLINRFIGRDFGPNFRLDKPLHKTWLDTLWQIEVYHLSRRLLRPTQMWAAVRKKTAAGNNIPKGQYVFFSQPDQVYNSPECRAEEYFYLCKDFR